MKQVWIALFAATMGPLILGRVFDLRTPTTVAAKLIAMGAMTTAIAVFSEFEFQTLVSELKIDSSVAAFLKAFLVAGFLEELIRYYLINHTITHGHFKSTIETLTASMWLSLGFAIAENVAYVLNTPTQSVIGLAFLRFLLPTFLHVFYGMILCAGLVGLLGLLSRYAFSMAVILHGTYDWYALSKPTNFGALFIFWLAGFIFTAVIIRRGRDMDSLRRAVGTT